MTIFCRRLKDNVKDELIRDGRRIDTLERLIKVVIDIDDKLYERAIEKRYNNLRSRVGTYTRSSDYRRGGSTRNLLKKGVYSNPYKL